MTGEDVAVFCDELLRNAKTYTENRREKLNKDIMKKLEGCQAFLNAAGNGALKKVPFLKNYTGILVHDHETVLYHFGTDHAECNVHLLRYLHKNTEETGNRWSGKMVTLLSEMNRARKEVMNYGLSIFPDETIKSYEQKYGALIGEGHLENKKTCHKYAKKEELLQNFLKYLIFVLTY